MKLHQFRQLVADYDSTLERITKIELNYKEYEELVDDAKHYGIDIPGYHFKYLGVSVSCEPTFWSYITESENLVNGTVNDIRRSIPGIYLSTDDTGASKDPICDCDGYDLLWHGHKCRKYKK